MMCPTVSLNAYYGPSHVYNPAQMGNASSYNQGFSGGVGISVNMSLFDPQKKDMINYQKKKLIADKLEQIVELEDSEFELRQTYNGMNSMLENLQDQEEILQKLENNIRDMITDINLGHNLPDPNVPGAVNTYIITKIAIISNYLNTQMKLSFSKQELLSKKFSIQQAMGVIFKEIFNSTSNGCYFY